MGTITVDNQHDADYWKRAFAELTGVPPGVEGRWNYTVTITADDRLLPQEAIDAMKAIYDRNKGRGLPVEITNTTPSIAEREAATRFAIHERTRPRRQGPKEEAEHGR